MLVYVIEQPTKTLFKDYSNLCMYAAFMLDYIEKLNKIMINLVKHCAMLIFCGKIFIVICLVSLNIYTELN